jgi:hypothetical protein
MYVLPSCYLQDYVTDAKPESQEELSDSAINNLDENMDYSLLTLLNETGSSGSNEGSSGSVPDHNSESLKEGALKGVYHEQYKHRIMTSQTFLRLLLHFMQDGSDITIQTHINDCWVQQFGSELANGGVMNKSYVDSCDVELRLKVSPSLKWSQAIDYGSQSMETYIWMLIYRLSFLSSQCIQVIKSPHASDISTKETQLVLIRELQTSIAELLACVTAEVLSVPADRYISNGSVHVLLQPVWIKKVITFYFYVVCVLFLQNIYY